MLLMFWWCFCLIFLRWRLCTHTCTHLHTHLHSISNVIPLLLFPPCFAIAVCNGWSMLFLVQEQSSGKLWKENKRPLWWSDRRTESDGDRHRRQSSAFRKVVLMRTPLASLFTQHNSLLYIDMREKTRMFYIYIFKILSSNSLMERSRVCIDVTQLSVFR